MILPFLLRCLRHGYLRGIEHIFNKYPVSRGGVVDQNVRDRADELAVLNDGRAAHALDNSTCFGKKCLVRDLYSKAFI